MRNARVIGNHVKKLASPLQRADHLRAPPFQDADHRAGVRLDGAGAQTLGPDIAPHQHAIFVQGRAGRVLRNGDFLEAGIVRLKKALALAVHPDPARNQICFTRLDVTVALDARDPARLLQFAERALQHLLAIGRQPKQPEQLRHIGRDVIFLAQQTNDLVFHDL